MDTLPPPTKPQAVITATYTLWGSVVVAIIKKLADSTSPETHQGVVLTIPLLITICAFIGILIFNISTGKNWARILLVFLTVLSLVPLARIMLDTSIHAPLITTLSSVQIVMQFYASFLLFTEPGSQWFKEST